jgi:thiol-disulfide isomerase/thioredoxin
VATNSTELALGTPAPAFTLPDVMSGRTLSLDEIAAGNPALVMFLCRHCPYVKHVETELAKLARDYAGQKLGQKLDRQLGLVAISANDAESYPEDAPPSLAEQARLAGFAFPYCYDESQAVARAYRAVCTPEFFLFDASRKLAYHGQLDGSRPGNRAPLDGQDLRAAIDAVLEGRPVAAPQRAAVGCSIKWRQ